MARTPSLKPTDSDKVESLAEAIEKVRSPLLNLASLSIDEIAGKIEKKWKEETARDEWLKTGRKRYPSQKQVKKYLLDLSIETAIWNNLELRHAFGFNMFKNRVEWIRSVFGGKAGDEWSNQDDMRVLLYVQKKGVNATKRHVSNVIDYLARQSPFDPVINYLESLEWDGKERLDTFLPVYFGGENTAYAKNIGSKFLISAIARQYKPGSQVDHMLILEGLQGLGKTRGLETLFGADWVNDNMPKINPRDSALALAGFMLVNIDELGKFSNERIRTLKAFLTMTEDKYNPKYENRMVSAPRRCVF